MKLVVDITIVLLAVHIILIVGIVVIFSLHQMTLAMIFDLVILHVIFFIVDSAIIVLSAILVTLPHHSLPVKLLFSHLVKAIFLVVAISDDASDGLGGVLVNSAVWSAARASLVVIGVILGPIAHKTLSSVDLLCGCDCVLKVDRHLVFGVVVLTRLLVIRSLIAHIVVLLLHLDPLVVALKVHLDVIIVDDAASDARTIAISFLVILKLHITGVHQVHLLLLPHIVVHVLLLELLLHGQQLSLVKFGIILL